MKIDKITKEDYFKGVDNIDDSSSVYQAHLFCMERMNSIIDNINNINTEVDKQKQKWDKRYLQVAELVATFSKDPSTQVGSVIIDAKGRPKSFGYNGLPRGVEDSDERLNNRDIKYAIATHSEINAILNASCDLNGCTLYCSHPVCSNCMSAIIQSGITRVVYKEASEDFMSRWEQSFKLTLDIAREASILVEKYIDTY